MSNIEFAVLDEDLDAIGEILPTPPKKGPGRPSNASKSLKAQEKPLEEQSDDMAKLVQEIASEAASAAIKGAMNEAQALKEKLITELEAKIKALSEQYVKPQNLVMHVKLGQNPAVKLKTRAAKILPDLLLQSELGRGGAGNWALMMGPTGCGKTVAAEQVSEVLKLDYAHLNFSEGCSETWLWGRQTPTGFVPGSFWNCYVNGGVFLADEIDACNDNVLLSLNTAIGNRSAANPINGEIKPMHKDFIFIAAANTNGKGGTGAYTGRTRLDGATLNRFSLFQVSYDKDLEKELCPDSDLQNILWDIRTKLEEKGSQDVISSRDMKNAYGQKSKGMKIEAILECLRHRMDKANHSLFVIESKSKKAAKNAIPF